MSGIPQTVARPIAPRFRGRLTFTTAIETVIDPAVALVWLLGLASWFDEAQGPRFAVAGLIAFTLTYPGNSRLTDSLLTVARKSLSSSLAVVAALSLFGYASSWLKFEPRRELLPWFTALPIALFAAHVVARSALPRLVALSGTLPRVVVCGVNDIGAGLVSHFVGNPFLGLKFVGYFDDRKRDRLTQIGDRALLGTFGELGDYARRNRIDQIYFALPMAAQPRIVNMLEDLKDTTASIFFAPDIFITDIINGRVESIGGMPIVAVRDTPFGGLAGLAKRLEDILLSALCLIASAPLMVAIAVAIKLSSGGPVLFKQRRYGLDGRDIVIYKYRSMSVTEDGSGSYTQVRREDVRVTRVGRFIRRTSLDELPQLINVLQGRMSLVGPRPHVVAVNEQFRTQIPGYMLRHKIKPGLTGLAQIRGFRGGDDFAGMKDRIEADLEYLRTWSLALDVEIIVRTLVILTRDRRAF
jgi:putative colanic acid biosynthesis UDP-glucose lipid carrier transferase